MMKTARIVQSHIFGTSSGRSVSIEYRGKVLHSLQGHAADNPRMLGACLKWALNQGFTHWIDSNGHRAPIDPAIAQWQGVTK